MTSTLPAWAADISTVLLFANVGIFTALLLVFGLTEPWRKSWFGWAIILLTFASLQLSVRAVITFYLGEDYAYRDLVLLIGRIFLGGAGAALLIGLLRMKRRHPSR